MKIKNNIKSKTGYNPYIIYAQIEFNQFNLSTYYNKPPHLQQYFVPPELVSGPYD